MTAKECEKKLHGHSSACLYKPPSIRLHVFALLQRFQLATTFPACYNVSSLLPPFQLATTFPACYNRDDLYLTLWMTLLAAAAAAKSIRLYLTLCDPTDCSPPGTPVPGILQARTLEWVAISFSNAWKRKVKEKSLSLVWLLATPWTAAYQAPPSMGFSR